MVELWIDEQDGLHYVIKLDGEWWQVPAEKQTWSRREAKNQRIVRRMPVTDGHQVPDVLAQPMLRWLGVTEDGQS